MFAQRIAVLEASEQAAAATAEAEFRQALQPTADQLNALANPSA